MDENQGIYKKIKEQNQELSKWEKSLKENITKNEKSDINLFLIKKEWLDKYKTMFFNIQYNENIKKDLIISYINFFKYNDFQIKLAETIDIKTIKEIFPLNESSWLSFQNNNNQNNISHTGHFLNNMLLFEITNLRNSKLYGIYFYDINKNLRLAYLEKKDLNTDIETILNILKEKKNKTLGNEDFFYQSNELNFDLYILKYEIKNIENLNNISFIKITNKKNNKKKNSVQNNDNNKDQIPRRKEIKIKTITTKNNQFNKENLYKDKNNNSINKGKDKDYKDFINNKKSNLEKKKYFHIKFKDKSPIIIELKKKDKNININKINLDLRPKKEIKKLKRNNSAQIINLKAGKRLIHNNNLNFNEILPIKAEERKYIPGVIGLLNIGATCYMNATLQCFSNILGLRKQLLNKDMYEDLKKNKNTTKKVSFALAEVISNLWKNINKRFYAPENFKKLISEMNNLFVGVTSNNPKDLILFLLETMHKELNNPINMNKYNYNQIVDNRNFNAVFNEFSNNYINQNKSIISDEFYGFSNILTNCGFCHTIIYNMQAFNILFFSLEEIRKYKQYNHNIVNIYDCFDYYEKQDKNYSFYCNYCKQKYPAVQQSILISTPKNIIINLNRGNEKQFKVNIALEEYLNLKKYIYFKDIYYYELIGVICRFDSNDKRGHFIAYCKNTDNYQWYKYDDQNVTKSSFNEVKESGLPYALFYSYIQV